MEGGKDPGGVIVEQNLGACLSGVQFEKRNSQHGAVDDPQERKTSGYFSGERVPATEKKKRDLRTHVAGQKKKNRGWPMQHAIGRAASAFPREAAERTVVCKGGARAGTTCHTPKRSHPANVRGIIRLLRRSSAGATKNGKGAWYGEGVLEPTQPRQGEGNRHSGRRSFTSIKRKGTHTHMDSQLKNENELVLEDSERPWEN